jgi:glycosyltransferase involved in cell wall biosynthesis
MNKLIVVLPCYNEEDVLPTSINELTKLINNMIDTKQIANDSFLCFVDDGSKDNTWKIIEDTSKNNNLVKGIKLAKNKGHQNALLAGLLSNKNKADIYISIDCDLQDDIKAIPKMINSYIQGNEVIYGVRSRRETDTLFKRKSAEIFYDIQGAIGVDIIKNHADYRLISNRVLNYLEQYTERNLYLRAMFPLIGFSSDIVYYERKERFAGESKYPLKKMLSFAWDGITSFSTMPLKIITILGAMIFLGSMLMILYIVMIKLFTMQAIPGWASTTIPIYFIGGVQLLSIGILGEYIGKIYTEVKQRPRYIIEKSTSE